MSDKNGLPSKGSYTVLMILGFFLGLIWGILSIGPYRKMSIALDAGDADTAWVNANKIRKWFRVGAAFNICMILMMMCQISR